MNYFWLFLLLICQTVSGVMHAGQAFTGENRGDADTLKIAVITDIHYLSPQLAEAGKALSGFEEATGRKITDLHEVLNVVLTHLGKEAPHVLLVAGDITNHGERRSHLGFIELLAPLQKSGTRIFVIPGNHDVNISDANAYKGETRKPVEGITAGEFVRLYGAFGYDDALQRDSASLSYLAELDEKIWLLAIDSNQHQDQSTSVSAGRILPETMEWALRILREAKEKGITVLGMMHHGLVEHMPYQESFFPDYLVNDWRTQAGRLADAGLGIIFTGHFHANDISLFTSPAGNKIYDVETASLAQYPFAYRIMLLQHGRLSVNTHFVTSIPGNTEFESESRRRLEAITRRTARNRLNNISGLPFPDEIREHLTEMIVQLNLMHVRGDEANNPRLQQSIALFEALMGAEAETDSLVFDFPPVDNNVILTIGTE